MTKESVGLEVILIYLSSSAGMMHTILSLRAGGCSPDGRIRPRAWCTQTSRFAQAAARLTEGSVRGRSQVGMEMPSLAYTPHFQIAHTLGFRKLLLINSLGFTSVLSGCF